MNRQTYQLKVTLDHVKPPVWRRILVPEDITLAKLHDVLQIAMGWTDSHLHMFVKDGVEYGDPDPLFDDGSEPPVSERRARLSDLLRQPRSRLRYEYDFGDGWQHTVVLESILAEEAIASRPVCLAGKRSCPPEDCGGPYGYAELLDALADPKNPEHDELSEWIGGDFDPDEFDLATVNAALARLRFSRRSRSRGTASD